MLLKVMESFHFDVPCIIKSSGSEMRQLSRFTFRSLKRYTKNCLWRAKSYGGGTWILTNILMPREWRESESFEYSRRRVGCCAIANLGAANSFPDTSNSSTAKRCDKNAKRSEKMRCSLPHSSFFDPLRYMRCVVKGCYKFEDVDSLWVCKT